MPKAPETQLSRRELIGRAALAGSVFPLAQLAGASPSGEENPASTPTPPQPAPSPAPLSYLEAARRAARWIHTSRVETIYGTVWLNAPERPEGFQTTPDLYSGNAGIVLFLLELDRATGEEEYRKEAARGGFALADGLPPKLEPAAGFAGFYAGFAGVGATLERLALETKIEAHREGARRCRDLVHGAAQEVGRGVEWGATTDIVAGAAGIGLYLLERARLAGDPASRELAVRAGLRLLEVGIAENGGRKWRMNPETARLMPNFSHGTAGVCYFLSTLYLETKRPEFLAGALEGAKYLLSIAQTESDGCLIFHDQPDNPSLYYLGWCHGPAGTARAFYQLHRASGEAKWLDWSKRGAKSLLASGIPEHPAPGFWNNVGQCCGSAGVGEYFLGLHRLSGEEAYLVFARRLAQDLLRRATPTPGDGLKWVHAEHRIRPEYAYAQTGFMQGAAGLGLFLLHLDAVERKREWTFALPDNPWGEAVSTSAPGPPASPRSSLVP